MNILSKIHSYNHSIQSWSLVDNFSSTGSSVRM